jgi:preprotein translocase subunit SecG
MESFLVVLRGVMYGIHILVCLVMILAILLQSGKSAGIGTALGGGGSQTLFGAGGGQGFLAKFTTASAIIFMLTSVGLAKLSTPSESRFAEKATAHKAAKDKQKGVEVDLGKLGVSLPEETAAPEAAGGEESGAGTGALDEGQAGEEPSGGGEAPAAAAGEEPAEPAGETGGQSGAPRVVP